ncbi:putative peptidase [Bacillus sp. TS-2]|nr:putative peptidase [Bacillus sp. TS-2]
MHKVLAIDTSSFVLGVALIDEKEVLGEIITNSKKNHALRLMPAVSALLEDLKVEPKELTHIIVANGPGSYTGVRIGVTTAKTLAWSLGIPLITVSSLENMAQVINYYNGFICPIIDARRGQVFTGLYKRDSKELVLQEKEQLTLLQDWLQYLKAKNEPVLFTGKDLTIHEDEIKNQLGELALFAPATMRLPRPAELAHLGMLKSPVNDVHQVTPQYLRLAEAEAKWREAQEEKRND